MVGVLKNRFAGMFVNRSEVMHFVSHHEAGHAVASILAFRALGRSYPAFDRVFVRPDFSSPYIDRKGRSIDCAGLCEGPNLYTPKIGLLVFNMEPALQAEILQTMEWSMVISFAGPFAEAIAKGLRSRRDKRWTALFSSGAEEDYRQAEAVLADYKQASKRRYGLRHFEELAWDLALKQQSAIAALASSLLSQLSLEYDQAHGIVSALLKRS
jgi:hypothetical protein